MTVIDKDNIRRLRVCGLGYKTIAAQLGLPVDSVKGFCRRNGLTAKSGEPAGNVCLQCGKALGDKRTGAEKKKFCSDACRYKWWGRNAAPQEKNRRVCAYCGLVFYSRKPRKYCGHPCYIRARFGGQHNEA